MHGNNIMLLPCIFLSPQMPDQQKNPFLHGMRDAIPIAMGYYAVAFSMGILAGKAGLTAIEGFISSFFIRASAGEYVVYSMVAIGASYMELAAMSVIANIRYMLMSTALTQKLAPDVARWKRLVCSTFITDEVFAISIAHPHYVPPAYIFGAFIMSTSGWASGNVSGIIAGNVLPANIVSALSVALYGMFIAIIVPPARHDKAIAAAVAASFLLSGACAAMPVLRDISSGMRTIILTIAISAVVAKIKPMTTTADRKETIDNEH